MNMKLFSHKICVDYFLAKYFWQKAVHKMLVKLTPDLQRDAKPEVKTSSAKITSVQVR
jgi:hypothetical protein